MHYKGSFVTIPFKSILVIGMSDSGGFLGGLKSKLNDAVGKIKEMAGSPTDPPKDPPGPPPPPGPPGPPPPPGPPTPPPPTEPTVGETILYYLNIASIVIVPILFAVIVANEMIIYRPAIRLFYFIIIFILCVLFLPFRIIISIYYFIRWAFNKYKKSEGVSSGFFPKIYAFIPWSTEYNTIWPLRYLTPDIGETQLGKAFEDKSFQKDLKKAYYLGEKMVEYFDVLQSANPYREYPAYKKNFENVTKSLFEMHMPGLKIDYKNHAYIIQVNHGKGDPEFIKITEHSMVPDIKKSVTPNEKGIPMAKYDKANQKFILVQANGTVEQATPAQMPSTIAQTSQLSPPGPATPSVQTPTGQ